MRRYGDEYNPILEYWEEIQDGREIVSQKVFKTYRHVVRQLQRQDAEYFYSPRRANHVIEFVENFCRNSKGKSGGQLVTLELWQKAMLATVFGFVDGDGRRQYLETILIVGKKNGKSTLASAVGLYLLTADGEAGPEIYAVATKRDQAKIIWSEAKRMVKKSPALSKRIRALVAELAADYNDGSFRALASDTDTLDGLNIHGALMDEIHQWKSGRALYDIIADGVTAREQPLILITSTAGTIREDIYDEKYEEAERIINGYDDPEGYHDDRRIAFVYELDGRDEWTKKAAWRKANPGLGTIKSMTALEERVERAKKNPALVRNLVCKDFNIRETSTAAWLNFDELDCRDTFELDRAGKCMIWTHYAHDGAPQERRLSYPRYGIGGADLSKTTDLTAAKVIFTVPELPEYIFVLSMYWLPQELLERRVHEDHIPYDKWEERGLCRLCEGNKIRYEDVRDWFVEIQEQKDIYLPYIGYDAWSATYWTDSMEEYFGRGAMIPVHQGVKSLSEPMKRVGSDLASKRVIYNNNPIDKWCLANTAYDEDRNGNIQPHKTSRPTRRIDGTAALLDAYAVLDARRAEYESML